LFLRQSARDISIGDLYVAELRSCQESGKDFAQIRSSVHQRMATMPGRVFGENKPNPDELEQVDNPRKLDAQPLRPGQSGLTIVDAMG
jgi:hypothetical protein